MSFNFSHKPQYSRRYADFVGIDTSHDESEIALNRMASGINVWRDYRNERGGFVETIPGFRKLFSLGNRVHGIYQLEMDDGKNLLVHSGTKLYRFAEKDRDVPSALKEVYTNLADSDSQGFVMNRSLYLLDGEKIIAVNYDGTVKEASQGAYIPVTYSNDERYEQRNMLSNQTINRKYAPEARNEPFVMNGAYRKIGQLLYSDLICSINGGLWELLLPSQGFFEGNKTIRSIILNEPQSQEDVVEDTIPAASFKNSSIESIMLHTGSISSSLTGVFTFGSDCFSGCKNLKTLFLQTAAVNIEVNGGAFDGCGNFTVYTWRPSKPTITGDGASALKNAKWVYNWEGIPEIYTGNVEAFTIPIYDPALSVSSVKINGEEISLAGYAPEIYGSPSYKVNYYTYGEKAYAGDITIFGTRSLIEGGLVEILLNCDQTTFQRPGASQDTAVAFPEGDKDYSGTSAEAVNKCRIAAVYDGRVFLTGNPDFPNTVFYSQRDLTGYNNPTYFGVYNYFNDGIGNTPNVAMISSPYMLMVLKKDTTQEDGSIFYHQGADNSDERTANIIPRIYPSIQGIVGRGCLGAAISFYDDPVFLSSNGLNGVDKETVNLERTIGHRSTLIDRELLRRVNENSRVAVWDGYLCVLTDDGTIFLADGRQPAKVDGYYQYEWFILGEIGTWEGQTERFFWGTFLPTLKNPMLYPAVLLENGEYKAVELHPTNAGKNIEEGTVVYSSTMKYVDEEGDYVSEDPDTTLFYTKSSDGSHLYVADSNGEMIGGTFSPACNLFSIEDRLYFGTESGDLCLFNTDKRGEDENEGDTAIPRRWYSFDGRAITSGFSTAFDPTYYPDMSKNTVRKSLVLEVRNRPASSFVLYVRTDRQPWKPLVEANTGLAFDDFSFDSLSFSPGETATLPIHETEMRWVKKQYYIGSSGFCQPMAINSIGYRYIIAGGVR